MEESFEAATVTDPLPWTGERYTTQAGHRVETVHLHRYFLARSICRGLDVLDLASGEGYGSFFLAQTARSVIGLDIDGPAVAHAAATYAAGNLRILRGDARRLPLRSASFDAVVSFATIEHVAEHAAVLAEIRRVLRPGGYLIASTLDCGTPPPQSPVPPPAHALGRAKFAVLLQSAFRHVTLFGQRHVIGSVLLAERPARGDTLCFERRSTTTFEVSDGLPGAEHVLAIASDADIPALPDSLYLDGITPAPHVALRGEIQRLRAALLQATDYARHLEAGWQTRSQEVLDLQRRLAEHGAPGWSGAGQPADGGPKVHQ